MDGRSVYIMVRIQDAEVYNTIFIQVAAILQTETALNSSSLNGLA